MENRFNRLVLLAVSLVVCGAVIVWGLASLDHGRDWNVPGATTGSGKKSLVQ